MFKVISTLLKKIGNKIENDSFLKGVASLSTGIGLAQLIIILSSPIITRLYNPSEVGILSGFAAFLGIILIAGTWRFERAIPLATSKKIVSIILLLGITLLIVNTSILSIIVNKIDLNVLKTFNAEHLSEFLWLLPIGFFFGSLYELLTYIAVRHEDYKTLSITKLFQGIGMVTAQISLGILNLGAYGLIIGDVIGRFLGIGRLLKQSMQYWNYLPRKKILLHLIAVIHKYWKFPIISAPTGIINRSTLLAPQLLLLALYDAKTAGYVFIAQNTLLAPLSFIGRSVAKVFFGHISRYKREKSNKLLPLVNQTVKRLFFIGTPPTLIIILFGSSIFEFIFGKEWVTAGEYAQYLAISLLFRFAISPLLQALIVLEHQGLLFIFDLFRLLFTVGIIYIMYFFASTASQTIIAYSVCITISYIIGYMLIITTIQKTSRKQLPRE